MIRATEEGEAVTDPERIVGPPDPRFSAIGIACNLALAVISLAGLAIAAWSVDAVWMPLLRVMAS